MTLGCCKPTARCLATSCNFSAAQQPWLISPVQCQNDYASLQLELHHFGSLWAFVFCSIPMTWLFGEVRRKQQRPVKRRKLLSFSRVGTGDFPRVRILKSD